MHTLCKNACELVHARLCNGAEPSLPWKLLRTYLESCASIVQAVICRPPSCRLDKISCPTLFAQEIRPNPRQLMTRSPLRCCASIIQSSMLVQASSSLSISRPCAWPRRLLVTRIHFRHFLHEFSQTHIHTHTQTLTHAHTRQHTRQHTHTHCDVHAHAHAYG